MKASFLVKFLEVSQELNRRYNDNYMLYDICYMLYKQLSRPKIRLQINIQFKRHIGVRN